jgi:hypothetical protein
MSNYKDNGLYNAVAGANPLRNFILLALPWISFQRDMLAVLKKSVEGASESRPFERLTLHELCAMMMIMDPSRTGRNLLGPDFEKKLEETFAKILPKLTSGSMNFIEAQDIVLESLSDILKARKDQKT